ncbi:cyclic GMP-AMP synthase-like receptor [Lineus longissimus]|uniref:cyclic GMP-AMP synthase-like receptor n=1 Tax=Lineus longissimus TaxID=88925 RepID=UPI00315DC69A
MISRKTAKQKRSRGKGSVGAPYSTEPIKRGHGHSSFGSPRSGEPIIRCHVCGQSSFKTPHSLQQHLKSKSDRFHKENRPYPKKCRRCGERFLTRDGMMLHGVTCLQTPFQKDITVDSARPEAADSKTIGRGHLQESLERYFRNHVEIDSSEMEEAKSVAWEIAKHFREDLKKRSQLDFMDIIPVGSSFDGLKVAPPNEFDMIIPIKMDIRNWEVVDGRNAVLGGVSMDAPGFYLVRKVTSRTFPKRVLDSRKRKELEREKNHLDWLDQHFVKKEDNRDYFKPGYLLRDLQKIVHRSIRSLKKVSPEKAKIKKVSGGVNGPAMKLTVVFIPTTGKNLKEFTLDFVLEVRVGGTKLVAKRHPSITQDDFLHDDPMTLLWQESWAEPESIKIREISDEEHGTCRKKCWRLFKGLCLRNRHLSSLCSYFYKTLFLNFLEERQDLEDWAADKLVDRFLDAFSYMEEVLERKWLPVFFLRNHGDVNMLLPRYKEMMVENIYYFVRKMNADSSHMQLLHLSQSNISKSEQPKSKVKIPRKARSRSFVQNPARASGSLGYLGRKGPARRYFEESDSDEDSDLDLDRHFKFRRLQLHENRPSSSSSSF